MQSTAVYGRHLPVERLIESRPPVLDKILFENLPSEMLVSFCSPVAPGTNPRIRGYVEF